MASTLDLIEPATGKRLSTVPEAGAEDVDRAVRAADGSFTKGEWRDMHPRERGQIRSPTRRNDHRPPSRSDHHMPDRPHLGAVVLAGAIEATAIPDIVIEAHLTVPPVYRAVRAARMPLDLDADLFHYRVGSDGIGASRRRRAARTCRERHRRKP